MSFEARKPDYILKFINKRTNDKGRIGAAWLNESGNISIILDPKVLLTQDVDEKLTLFPADKE